ncbi:MAG TPA: AAA domain-containing protein [Myxococcus sp.]|nr:AAA domain-containing protein [Myxococcus sp.]
MKVHELQYGEVTVVEVEPTGGKDFGARVPVLSEALLHFPGTLGRALLAVDGRSWAVKAADTSGGHALERLAERNLPRLCWVAATIPKKAATRRLVLHVHEFPALHLWPDAIDVGVDDSVVEQVRRKQGGQMSPAAVVAWLADRTLLPATGEEGSVRLLLSGGAEAGAQQRGAFDVLGQGITVKVVRGSDERLRVLRVTEARRPERRERRPVLLAQARWRFCEATQASQFRGTARTQLDDIVERSGSSYLRVWHEYNLLERQSILRRARAFGWLRYGRRERREDGGWRFHLHKQEGLETKLQGLREVESLELEAAEQVPVELLQEESEAGTGLALERSGRKRAFTAPVASVDGRQGTVDLRTPEELEDEEPPAQGVLFSSLEGDRKRLARREEAWNLIASAECPMPRLGLLIEDQPVRVERRRSEKALSESARRVFGGEPTARQVEALRVALETPDIALFQGPPGTGKTRTIAALQVRLAELTDDVNGVSGQTLLTSYQHFAVENAAAKTLVFGLPAIKVGRRRGQTEESDGFDRWRRDRAEHVRADLAQLPDRPLTQVLRHVRNVASAYVSAPGREDESPRVLRDVEDLAGEHLPPALRDKLVELRRQLQRGPVVSAGEAGRELLLKTVRALRTEAVSFSDDGPRNARAARVRLGEARLLEPEEQALLEQASRWDAESQEAPGFLGALGALKERLLERLLPVEPRTSGPRVNADVEQLLSQVVDALYWRVRESAAGPDAVLATYLDDLENDVEGVREAVRDYTVVLAATCQQSVGRDMSLAKDDGAVFTNVIVDEAARANPLDLLIPLARAERRIILVGDHRQLPHILEPDVEQLLERSVQEEAGELLRRSLFHRLFMAMKAREARDGIPRTVTLDVQYRMHPVLGDFVSDTFYKKHEEGFRSGSPASDFVHGIERYREDAVAAWVDLPLVRGPERGGQSKSRPVEARWIAREVAGLLDKHPGLSFGVIAFYASQVRELMREMEVLGLTEQAEEGYTVVPALRELRDARGTLKERLRVGTVDAFQGKEFDVVFLSMTRSNDVRVEDVRSQRRKYGHLMLENRLCVAMSRQQRLLVVVGDADMVRGPEAKDCIPGLVAFRKLCEGSHGICLPA